MTPCARRRLTIGSRNPADDDAGQAQEVTILIKILAWAVFKAWSLWDWVRCLPAMICGWCLRHVYTVKVCAAIFSYKSNSLRFSGCDVYACGCDACCAMNDGQIRLSSPKCLAISSAIKSCCRSQLHCDAVLRSVVGDVQAQLTTSHLRLAFVSWFFYLVRQSPRPDARESANRSFAQIVSGFRTEPLLANRVSGH